MSISPSHDVGRNSFGVLLVRHGGRVETQEHIQETIKIKRYTASPYFNMAAVLAEHLATMGREALTRGGV